LPNGRPARSVLAIRARSGGVKLGRGFPFQTTIADLVRSDGRWRIDDEEFPWRDDAGRDHFLDLAAVNSRCIVTFECKKTEKEIYTFLLPQLKPGESEARALRRARCDYLVRINDSSQRLELF